MNILRVFDRPGAFREAREAIVALNVPVAAPQLPWLDDNGDGAYSLADGALAGQRTFGDTPAFGFLVPEITDARPRTVLHEPADLELWCKLGPGEVKSVEAIVSYSGTQHAVGEPITNFATLDLQREGTTPRWSATLPASTFAQEGTYQILYTATRDDGFGVNLAATPVARTVYIGVPPALVQQNSWILYE